MSGLNDCCAVCPDVQVTNVPGVAGADGAAGEDGVNGVNAFTTVASPGFNVPAPAGTVTIPVGNSTWMVVGQNIFIEGPANFEVVSIPGPSSVELEFLDYQGDVAMGTPIAAGAGVSLGGLEGPPIPGPLPTAITDNSTGTASNTIAAGAGVATISIPITLVQITGAADVLTTYTPGYKFKILGVDARVVEVATTVGKAVSLNLEIGTTDLTGGVVALTSANCTPLGAAIAGSAVTGNNTGTAADTVSIEASSVTAFAEGAVVLLIRIQNMDTADAIASLADHINDLIAAL